MPKVDVVGPRAGVLELFLVACLLAQLGEAQPVKLVGLRPEIRISVDGICADHDGVAGWNDVAGRRLEARWAGHEAWNVGFLKMRPCQNTKVKLRREYAKG